MRTIACVVCLVTGPVPACLASFSDSTEKLASAVVMPPIVIAMCIQDKKVLSFAADKPDCFLPRRSFQEHQQM